MVNILLTGATGFLGSSLLKKLILGPYKVIIIKRSFSNTSRIDECLPHIKYYNLDEIDIKDVFLENSIDVIIHTATDYGRKSINVIDTALTNLVFPLKLLIYGMETGNLKAFINTDTIIDKNTNPYSLSKHQFSDWLELYSKQLKCINIRLEHFYGFQDDTTKFISNIIYLILKNTRSIDLTLGEQQRDFIYIDDVVLGFMTILQSLDSLPSGYTDIPMGTGENISIRHCVETIKKIAKNSVTHLDFGVLPYREHELMHSNTNIEKLLALGWAPKVFFQEGIKKTIAMERENLK